MPERKKVASLITFHDIGLNRELCSNLVMLLVKYVNI